MKSMEKKLQPDFVDGIAAVENESGRDGHGQRRQPADIAADERLEFHRQIDANDADEDHRQAQGPKISPEQRLRKEEDVKMKRAVIICRVVSVKTGS